MYLYLLYITTLIVSLSGRISAASLADPDVTHETRYNAINADQRSPAEDPVKQVMYKECLGSYTPFCMKLSLMNMIGRIGIINLPILPGITLRSTGLPPSHSSVQRLLKQPDLVDNLLMERLSDYLGTLSLNVKILENGENAEGGAQGGDNGTGRKKDKGGGAILAAGMMSAGTVLAVKLAALAAISGKALMAALMAMMLAAIAALSKGGGEDHKTTYEIVAKPVVSHSHTHSSEIQHGHGHYKRSLDAAAHRMAFARQLS